MRSFVDRTLKSARKGTTEDDILEAEVMEEDALEEFVSEQLSPEDAYLRLTQQVVRIAGQSDNLNIYHPGHNNVTFNVINCQNVQQNVFNITTVNLSM